MPPLPQVDGAFNFLDGRRSSPVVPTALANAVQGLNLGDMIAGTEKEHEFTLLPGEAKLNEVTIRHQHLLLVKSGVTRLTLTTHRLLYTRTRVFSPVYWLLLVLFPPLIFYYVARIARNRNVALPLGSIDSIEKRDAPNWVLFVLAMLGAYVMELVCTVMFGWLFAGPHGPGGFGAVLDNGELYGLDYFCPAGPGGTRLAPPDANRGDRGGNTEQSFLRPVRRRERRGQRGVV